MKPLSLRSRFLSVFALAAFAVAPLTVPIPLRAADISQTAASVVPSSQAHYNYGTAGATIVAGNLVYLDPVTSTYKLVDANLSATAATVAGMAVNNASSGQPETIVTFDPALAVGGTVAAGAVVIASATDASGAIAPVADAASGWYVTVIGVGIGSNKIYFQITPSGVVK